MKILELIMTDMHQFNAGALKRSLIDYYDLVIKRKGKMFLSMAGAMSSAQIGITLSEAIRRGLIHGISCTGANIEESLFRLVAGDQYKSFPDYRYLSKNEDTDLLEKGLRRVTDMSIPEDEAFRKMEEIILPLWEKSMDTGQRANWHEYFYQVVLSHSIISVMSESPKNCWIRWAAEKGLPMVVPGYEDSTFGNIFASYCSRGELSPSIVKSGIEQMMYLYEIYQNLSKGAGVGFFQIGGGIAGDFPICVVPSIKYDLEEEVDPWAYFCQISDSTTSYGSYSGAPPNEKITWDKLTAETPAHVIESDATIVFPLIMRALFEAQDDPDQMEEYISEYNTDQANRKV